MMGEPQRKVEAIGIEFHGNGASPKFESCVINVNAGMKGMFRFIAEQGPGAKRKAVTTCNQQRVSSNPVLETDDHIDHESKPKHKKLTICQTSKNSAKDIKIEKMSNHVWMNVQSGGLVSVFCQNVENLEKAGKEYLDDGHQCLTHLPSEVVADVDGVVRMGFKCDHPPHNMTITPIRKNWKLTERQLLKDWHQFHFNPQPKLNESAYTGPYALSHQVKVFDIRNQLVKGEGFQVPIQFDWPLSSKHGNETAGQQPESSNSAKVIKVSNVNATNLHIAGMGNAFNYHHESEPLKNQLSRLKTLMKENYTPRGDAEHLSKIETMLDCAEMCHSTKKGVITPEGGFMELDGCKIKFPPGGVQEKTEVIIFVSTNAGQLPDSAEMISPSFKCKPSTFIEPVHVSLPSWFTPKSDKKAEVKIMSKTGNAEWTPIIKANLKNGNVEYDTVHFCAHAAAVSMDDAKNGLYYLLNDVWMHEKTGRIVSFFCKDKKAFEEARKRLAVCHKHIIPLPNELIVELGNTIVVEFQHPQNLKMLSIDDTNSRLKITQRFLRKNILMLHFRPDHRQENIERINPCDLVYQVTTLDSTDQILEEFFAPLYYTWPTIPFEQSNSSSEGTGGKTVITTTDLRNRKKRIKYDFKDSVAQIHKPCGKDSSSTAIYQPYHMILIDGWMHVEDAQLFFYFCKDMQSVEDLSEYLKPDHERISIPEEVIVRVGNKIETKLEGCNLPDMWFSPLDDGNYEVESQELQRKWFEICYESIPDPDELQLPAALDLSLHTRILGHDSELLQSYVVPVDHFQQPRFQKHKEYSEQGASASGKHITVSNLHVGRDIHIGGQGTHVDNRDSSSRNVDSLSAMAYLNRVHTALNEFCALKARRVKLINPEGESIELDKCRVDIQPDSSEKNKIMKITVKSNPENLPKPSAVVSHALECETPKSEKQVHVSLISCLTPKPGEELRVDIMNKTGQADWEKIQDVLIKDGNTIKYDVSHFCWHVAVVSEEEEKKGLYYLLNDVWMHKNTGRILSLFWKDEVFLKKGSKALEADHKRIISVPIEVIVGIGSTIKVEVECRSPAGFEMLSADGSNSTLEITHEAMKKNFLSLLFEPNLKPDTTQSTGRFRVVYRTRVFDAEDQLVNGGFCTLLHYKWPQIKTQILPDRTPMRPPAGSLHFTSISQNVNICRASGESKEFRNDEHQLLRQQSYLMAKNRVPPSHSLEMKAVPVLKNRMMMPSGISHLTRLPESKMSDTQKSNSIPQQTSTPNDS